MKTFSLFSFHKLYDLPAWERWGLKIEFSDRELKKRVGFIELFGLLIIFHCYLQPSFLHTDFNKWRDEDDSEGEDLGMEDNFEAVSYTQYVSQVL